WWFSQPPHLWPPVALSAAPSFAAQPAGSLCILPSRQRRRPHGVDHGRPSQQGSSLCEPCDTFKCREEADSLALIACVLRKFFCWHYATVNLPPTPHDLSTYKRSEGRQVPILKRGTTCPRS